MEVLSTKLKEPCYWMIYQIGQIDLPNPVYTFYQIWSKVPGITPTG